MRAAFGSTYGISVALPNYKDALYKFDLAAIQASIDWFNVMAYDNHGDWDNSPRIAPHTNLTDIEATLDLMWNKGVNASKVVLGKAWYAHSYTLKDPKCNIPNGVCLFAGDGAAEPCSNSPGELLDGEIVDIISDYNLTPVWDKMAAVKWITWNINQWATYDDDDTFWQKRTYANSRCLGGMMVWAIDQLV